MCTEYMCDNCNESFGSGETIVTEEGYRFCDECAEDCTWNIYYDDTGDTFYYLIETAI